MLVYSNFANFLVKKGIQYYFSVTRESEKVNSLQTQKACLISL